MSECKPRPVPKSKCHPPPVMRHLHRTQSLRNVVMAVTAAGLTATTFYLLYNRPRKMAYRRFYETYDAEAAFQRMRDGGYLQACSPGDGAE